MATRGSDDPRCPECGEPVGAAASWCMHCGAELPLDDSADVSSADDVSYGTGSGSHGSEGTGSDDGGVLETLQDVLAFNQTADPSSADVDHEVGRIDAGGAGDADVAGDDVADPNVAGGHDPDADVAESAGAEAKRGRAETHQKASLALRAPTAFIVSLPIAFGLLLVVLPSVGQLSGSLAGLVWFVAWIGAITYLARKPLPSDIVGDAFYVYAGILLALPFVIGLTVLSTVFLDPASTESTVGDVVLMVVFMEFFFAIPAGFLAGIGLVGNWWAKRKLSPE